MESPATQITDPQLEALLGALHFARLQQGVTTMRWAVDRAIEMIPRRDGAKEQRQDGEHQPQGH